MTSLTHLEEDLMNGLTAAAAVNGVPSTSVNCTSSSTCSQGQPPPPLLVTVPTATPTQQSTLTSSGRMGPPIIPKPKPKRWVSRNKYLLGSLSLSDDDDEERGRTKGNKGKAKKGQQENTHYTCDLCDGKFSSSSSLQKHQRVHTGERPFECTICSKRFVTKFALERHAIGHDPNSSKAIVCNICDKRFSTKEWLIIHVRSHTGDTPFNCDTCDKKFTSQSSLNRHALSHKSEKGYLCQECGKLYQSSQAMRVHLESHGVERNYPCPKCRMRFRRALDLQRHSMTHQDVQMLPCPLPSCEHQFRRKDNLLRHLQLTHNQTREEAHETFNLLNTSSSKSSECNDSESAPGSVSASSDSHSEIASTPASLDGIDESPRTSAGGRSNRRKNNQKKTKAKVKRSQKKTTTAQNPKPRKRKNPQVQGAPPPEAAVSEEPDSSIQSIPIEENMTEITRSTLLDPKCTQIPVQPTTAFTEGTTNPPTKGVTTSVIIMAKSSPQQQNHHYHPRKKHKRTNDDTTTNTELDDDINYDNHPKSPSSNTLLPVPYPTRNISPGQEYINYLNNLNNPIAYRVRDRSSSFQNRQSLGISSSRNYGQNNSNRMESSYPTKYSEHEVSYNCKENQNNNNFSDVMSTNQQINIHQTGNPDTFTFQGNNYDISASSAPGYFQPPQIQYQLGDSEMDAGYLDLSLSSPPDSMFDRRNNSSFPPSSSMRTSSYPNGSNLVPTSSYYTMETNGLNYDQQQQFISEDLTPLCYVQSLSQQENSKESMTRNVSSNYDGGYYETPSSSSLVTYSVMQPLLEASGDMYQNQEISLTQQPPHLVDYIEESCERPFNVTVIKRASASHQQELQNNQNIFQESHYQRNFQEMNIQDFSQAGSSSSGQHIISGSSMGLGVGPISITLSSSEDETGPSSKGDKILYQHPYHQHGGKDMIVNRDPRKNFLHRESRNKNQQD